MNRFLGLGKALSALFWAVALANLAEPFGQPFALLLQLAAAFMLLIHGMELYLFDERISSCDRPWKERAQVLVFGVFHALTLPAGQLAEYPQSPVQLQAEQA